MTHLGVLELEGSHNVGTPCSVVAESSCEYRYLETRGKDDREARAVRARLTSCVSERHESKSVLGVPKMKQGEETYMTAMVRITITPGIMPRVSNTEGIPENDGAGQLTARSDATASWLARQELGRSGQTPT